MATITFKVKGNTYTCEEGTTWKEFIENSPNHYPIMKRIYRDNGADGSYSRPWVKYPFFDNAMIVTRGYRTDGSYYLNYVDIESAIDPNQIYYRKNLDDDGADSYITIDNFRIVCASDISMGVFAYTSRDNYFGLEIENSFSDPVKTYFKGNQIYHSDGSMLMGDYDPKDGDAFYTLTKKEIKFKIDNKEFTSVAGLTWIDWVNSSYNTDGFTIDETDLTGYIVKDGNKIKSSEYARFDEEIIENETYTLMGVKKPILIKNPIILIGSKAKKVVVDNVNMTIDVWTKEVPAGLITFTIDGTSYQAESNMLWEDWVNSDYNTGGFDFGSGWVYSVRKESSGYYVYNTANDALVGKTGIETYSSNYELNIISNGVYKTKYLSHGGGSND